MPGLVDRRTKPLDPVVGEARRDPHVGGPSAARKTGKKKAAAVTSLLAGIILPFPCLLIVIDYGAVPERGSWGLTMLLATMFFLSYIFQVATTVPYCSQR